MAKPGVRREGGPIPVPVILGLMWILPTVRPVVRCKMPFGKLWPGSIKSMVVKVPVSLQRAKAKARIKDPGR